MNHLHRVYSTQAWLTLCLVADLSPDRQKELTDRVPQVHCIKHDREDKSEGSRKER